MHVQSAYNMLVPLPELPTEPSRYYALINTLAGSVDVVDRPVAEALRADENPPRAGGRQQAFTPPVEGLSPEVETYLDQRGYLFASPEEEQAQARILYEKMRAFHRTSVRQPVVVIPTYNCNMQCIYCWQRLHHLDSPVIKEAVVTRIFEVLPELVDLRRPERVDLVVFGGEPLQKKPELTERVLQFLKMGRARGFSTKVISNGTELASHVPVLHDKVDMVQITLDGPAEIHNRRRRLPQGRDSFTPIADGISKAVAAGMRINIRVNIDHENVDTMPELADYMISQGWLDDGLVRPHLAPVKNHNPRIAAGSEAALLEKTMDLVDRIPNMAIYDLNGFSGIKYVTGFKESGMLSLHRFFNCEAQISFLAFDLYGDLYPCWDAAGIKELAIGTFMPEVKIDEDKLSVWRDRNALDIEACHGCPVAPHCGGGCQFLAYEHTGRMDAKICDAMLDGYIHAIVADAAWLIERARTGDHVVGLVEGDRVRTAVRHPFGILAGNAGGADPAFNCS